jgi:uncharacterized protein YjbJ (UPF0337 family)
MNWDRWQGNWRQFKGGLREKWARLTNDRVGEANGRREVLAGKLQAAYGLGKEAADHRSNEHDAVSRQAHGVDTRQPVDS